jgi:pyruvate kinase
VEAVKMMAKIAVRTERERLGRRIEDTKKSIPNAISSAVARIAEQLDAAAIMSLTKTGSTARSISKFRPQQPILAVTAHMDVARRLQMVWGVKPLLILDLPTTGETFQAAVKMAQTNKLLKEGDLVVLSSGTQGVAGSTDLIKVEVVTAVLGQGKGIGQESVTGVARVLNNVKDINNFRTGDILVAQATDATYLDAIRKAAGIIVEDESLTCHAATLGLRLGKPVIVGVKDATTSIRDQSVVTLDVQRGLIYSGKIDI